MFNDVLLSTIALFDLRQLSFIAQKSFDPTMTVTAALAATGNTDYFTGDLDGPEALLQSLSDYKDTDLADDVDIDPEAALTFFLTRSTLAAPTPAASRRNCRSRALTILGSANTYTADVCPTSKMEDQYNGKSDPVNCGVFSKKSQAASRASTNYLALALLAKPCKPNSEGPIQSFSSMRFLTGF